MPSLVATFCSISACANEPPGPTPPRTSASLSAGTRPVDASRSATSSASALIGGGLPKGAPVCGVAPAGGDPTVRRFGGRSKSMVYPSNEVSADSKEKLSTFATNRTSPPRATPAWLVHQAEVRVQEGAAPEEGHDGSYGQEGAERDAHLARGAAVPGEQVHARDECRDHSDHQRHRDGASENGAHQQSELDVAHTHPGRVGQRGREQESRRGEGAERPFG